MNSHAIIGDVGLNIWLYTLRWFEHWLRTRPSLIAMHNHVVPMQRIWLRATARALHLRVDAVRQHDVLPIAVVVVPWKEAYREHEARRLRVGKGE